MFHKIDLGGFSNAEKVINLDEVVEIDVRFDWEMDHWEVRLWIDIRGRAEAIELTISESEWKKLCFSLGVPYEPPSE